MTPEEQKKCSEILLSIVPSNGSSIGNVTLCTKFLALATEKGFNSVNSNDYWDIRNRLIDDNKLGKAKGKGGSVFRILEKEVDQKNNQLCEITFEKETELYEPLKKMLYAYWPKENNIKNFVLEVTAQQGRRATGGRWTRPDLAIIAVNSFSFLPGKYLEITTFEIKPQDLFDITSVFEAAAHRAFSHFAYLAIHTSKKVPEDDDFERLKSECRRLGVGLITFVNPEKFETLEVLIDPERSDPPPFNVNEFIHKQISSENQTIILEMIK